ncbi:MAG: Gfo/Idh/MocA family oxidoreductase, partial [Lachnospiraceae bacterium]|nr:Gfo/Idh/MocA family oxidoreductase [Lachnospiraceae bacterium]
MKVVVIGLGSMGKRRIRLLKKYNSEIIIYGIDSNESRKKEVADLYDVKGCENIEDAVKKGVSCAFVSASPLAHAKIIQSCLKNNLHV